jgi:hypothetical protein
MRSRSNPGSIVWHVTVVCQHQLIGQKEEQIMEQQHESALVKRLEQLGITVDVSPTGITLTYEQISISGPTLEEAFITFLAEVLSRYEALRKWQTHTMPMVSDGLDKQ